MQNESCCTQAVVRFKLSKNDEHGRLIETIEGGDDLDYLIRTSADGRIERISLEEWQSQTPGQL